MSDNREYRIEVEPLELVSMYIDEKHGFMNLANEWHKVFSEYGFSIGGLEYQLNWRLNIIQSIESYLMSFMDDKADISDEEIIILATSTLAHFSGNKDQKQQIENLFKILLNNIQDKIKDKKKRALFGKTLFGKDISLDIEKWTTKNLNEIKSCGSQECIFKKMWPIISKYINNNCLWHYKNGSYACLVNRYLGY